MEKGASRPPTAGRSRGRGLNRSDTLTPGRITVVIGEESCGGGDAGCEERAEMSESSQRRTAAEAAEAPEECVDGEREDWRQKEAAGGGDRKAEDRQEYMGERERAKEGMNGEGRREAQVRNGGGGRGIRREGRVEEQRRGSAEGNVNEEEVERSGGGSARDGGYKKELTISVELMGDENVTMMALLNGVKEHCGRVMACRFKAQKTYEITMEDGRGKKRLMDGFKIGNTRVMAKEIKSNELVVSFLNLPPYITDGEIEKKMDLWGVKIVSPIKRRKWPGTDIADGTRFCKVQFTDEVQSLPYSTKFETLEGVEYFRVIHDRQMKVCRLCIQPGHILRECPDFKCHRCGKQGHYARECLLQVERRGGESQGGGPDSGGEDLFEPEGEHRQRRDETGAPARGATREGGESGATAGRSRTTTTESRSSRDDAQREPDHGRQETQKESEAVDEWARTDQMNTGRTGPPRGPGSQRSGPVVEGSTAVEDTEGRGTNNQGKDNRGEMMDIVVPETAEEGESDDYEETEKSGKRTSRKDGKREVKEMKIW